MLFPEQKEREKRFRLALRMGLPVFALAVITVTSLLLQYFNTIPNNFIIIAIALLGIMIYYLFYLIYQGFNERVTDPISHAFTREYFSDFIERESKKKTYTLFLFSVENLNEINKEYGFVNGDRVLYSVAMQLNDYFTDHGHYQVPIAHFKGGDFIVALEGNIDQYRSLMELLCIKFRQLSFEDIEIDVIGSMTDTSQTRHLQKLVERLYEMQNENRKMLFIGEEEIDPDTIEHLVIEAVEKKLFSFRYQSVYKQEKAVMVEMAVKMVTAEGQLIHQKRFMPVINRLGMLRRFDTIQTEAALSALKLLDEDQKIAINISPSTLRNPLFLDHVMMMLSNNNRLKRRMVFIISEVKYFHQQESFNARLQAFRRAGIIIALDRLGGLHTTMRYLYDLDIDMVRYESFLSKEICRRKTQAILKGFIKSASELGVESWIKLIEDEAQMACAKRLGIDLIQGNYLSPMKTLTEEDE